MTNTASTAFIGTWKLLSQHTHFPDGQIVPSRGEDAVGVLMYDTAGNMAVQLMRTDDHAGDYNDMRDLTTAMDGYIGYFGTYEIDTAAQVITHRARGSSFFGYRNSVQRRHYLFSDDGRTLTLSAEANDGSRRVLVWERVTA
jgi:hypothetical protein